MGNTGTFRVWAGWALAWVVAAAAAPVAAPVAAPSATVTPTEKLRVPRQTLTDVERHFDTKLASVGGANDPIDLLGAARGIYLDGYGLVLTAEASLIVTPGLNPFTRRRKRYASENSIACPC